MKALKNILVIFLLFSSTNLYAQSVRLTDTAQVGAPEVFLMPGKSPAGEKLFHFSLRIFKLEDEPDDRIKADSITFTTVSGKQITFTHPKKLIAGQRNENRILWACSFVLTPDEVAFFKKEVVAELLLLVNDKEMRMRIKEASANELKEAVVKYF